MRQPLRGRERGQALVEFALVLPLFMLLLLAVFDFGRVVWVNNMVQNAAREAARYAIVHGGTATTDCPVGPDYLGRTGDLAGCPAGGSPSTDAAKDVARGIAIGATDLTISICYGLGCSGDTHTETNTRGTPVTVVVATEVPLITGQLFRFVLGETATSFPIGASATMLVNT